MSPEEAKRPNPAPKSALTTPLDYSKMTSEQFRDAEAAFRAQLREGELYND